MVESYADPENDDSLHFKQELDAMVSRTLREDFADLATFCRRELYPTLGEPTNMEFGYQIAHASLPLKKAHKISCLTHTELMP